MRRICSLALAFVLSLSARRAIADDGPVRAVEEEPRGGFYLRASSGLGWLSVYGEGPRGTASISRLGASSALSIGGTLRPGLVLAGTLRVATVTGTFSGGPFENATVMSNDGRTTSSASPYADGDLLSVGGLVDLFPDPLGGWHVGAAFGVGGTVVTVRATDGNMGAGAFTGSLFAGYDGRLTRTLSFGAMIVSSAATRATMHDTADNDTGYRLGAAAIGLETSLLYY